MAISKAPALPAHQPLLLANEPYARRLPTVTQAEVERALPHSAWADALRTDLPRGGLRMPPHMPIKVIHNVAAVVQQLACGQVPDVPPARQALEFLVFASYADAAPLIAVALQALAGQDTAQMRASLRAVAPLAFGTNGYAQAHDQLVLGLLQHGTGLDASDDPADDAHLAGLLLERAGGAFHPASGNFIARFAPVDCVLQAIPRFEFWNSTQVPMLFSLLARATPAQAATMLQRSRKENGSGDTFWEFVATALDRLPQAEHAGWVDKILRSFAADPLPREFIGLFNMLPAAESQRLLRACSPRKQQQVIDLILTPGAGDARLAADFLRQVPHQDGQAGLHARLLAHAMTLPNANLTALWAQVPPDARRTCLGLLADRVHKLPLTAAGLRWFFDRQRSAPTTLWARLRGSTPLHVWLKKHHRRVMDLECARPSGNFAEWITVLRETGTLRAMLQSATHSVMGTGWPDVPAQQLAALTEFPELRQTAEDKIRTGLQYGRGHFLVQLLKAAPLWLNRQQIAHSLCVNGNLAECPADFLAVAEAQGLLGALLTQNFAEGWCRAGGLERVRSLMDACDRYGDGIDYSRCLAAVAPVKSDHEALEVVLDLCVRLDNATLRQALAAEYGSPFHLCNQAAFMRLAAMATERLGYADMPAYLSLALQGAPAENVPWLLQEAESHNMLAKTLAHNRYAAVMRREYSPDAEALQPLLNKLVAGKLLQAFVACRPECLAHFVGCQPPEQASALFTTLVDAHQSGNLWADPAPFVQAINSHLQRGYDQRYRVRACPEIVAFMQKDPKRWEPLLTAPR